MQHDEVIWHVINHGQCSYRVKTKTQNFCRNVFNVTGLCNRSSCPLANSRYATIREEDGLLFLYMKTIERAHMPNQLWERVKLPRNYAKALEQIDKHLAFWPKFLVHKNKQRLTKMTQYLIRIRRLSLQVKPRLIPLPAKQQQKEKRREAKAEAAAKIEKAIEKELLQRLQSGTYGDIYNFPMKEYERVLEMEEVAAAEEEGEGEEGGEEQEEMGKEGEEGEEEEDEEEEEEDEDEEEEEEEIEEEEEEEEDDDSGGVIEYVEDYELDEEMARGEEMEDLAVEVHGVEEDGDDDVSKVYKQRQTRSLKTERDGDGGRRKRVATRPAAVLGGRKRRQHVEVEYEEEREDMRGSR